MKSTLLHCYRYIWYRQRFRLYELLTVPKIFTLRRFCSVCAVCKKPIVPKKGETRVQKLRALGKEFHLHCFKCEVKQIKLVCPSVYLIPLIIFVLRSDVRTHVYATPTWRSDVEEGSGRSWVESWQNRFCVAEQSSNFFWDSIKDSIFHFYVSENPCFHH